VTGKEDDPPSAAGGGEEVLPVRPRHLGSAVRVVGGAVVLGVLVLHVGARPFLVGLERVDPFALAVALVVTSVTTVCCARRWVVVSATIGADPPRLGTAVAAYYRSQLVNATVPGGVVGDVRRGVRHRLGGGIGTGLRAVVWERSAGTLVHGAATALVLLLMWVVPSAARPWAAAAAVVAATLLLAGLRTGLREVCLLSLVAMAGHVLLFVVAARTVGVDQPTSTLVPVALVVLLASVVPTNIAGWGPREGAAAWAFAGVSDAGQGVTVSVVYGVMALVAVLPGLVLREATRHG
jgi:uncharacterized membrane protein YbhN (UPF0104 family)